MNHPKVGEGCLEELDKRDHIDHGREEAKRNYDRVDYVWPKDNPHDTLPQNADGIDLELRSAQLELRLAEIESAYVVLKDICEGRGAEVAAKNLRRKGFVGSSSRGLNGVNWDEWRDRFYLDQVTMLGHSFGAATVVEVLRNAKRFPFISQGIIYDIWGAAVRPLEDDVRNSIQMPLLGINSEAFMYWQQNFDTVTSLTNEAKEHGCPSWLFTVRGTVHISQSDFSILYPQLCTAMLKQTANPKRALDLNIGATLEFLKLVMAGRAAVIERAMKDEGILTVPVLPEVPTDHKPAGKWIAMRLRIPHEFKHRVLPSLERKVKGVLEPERSPEQEIWMHVASTYGDVRRWKERKAAKELEKAETEIEIVFEEREREEESREREASGSELGEKHEFGDEAEAEDTGSITS